MWRESGPERPAWVFPGDDDVIRVLEVEFPADARQRFLMVCEVVGFTALQRIEWRGRDQQHAIETFMEWRNGDHAVLHRSFSYPDPEPFHFRPKDWIIGFHAFPGQKPPPIA